MDSFTLTEVLRLHLLSSGSASRRLEGCLQTEDPGLMFKLENPNIVEDLGVKNVFEFSIGMLPFRTAFFGLALFEGISKGNFLFHILSTV